MATRRIGRSQEPHPCVLCVHLGLGDTEGEVHHWQEGRLGKRGKVTLRICPPHHRIGPLALHNMGKEKWLKHFGVTLEELLELSEPE
jgi:hypothetical protein